MRKTAFTLLPLTLCLCITAARAQHTVLDHQTPSPIQAALGERVLAELLSQTGGDDALFRKVTGAERLPTQKLFLSVPDAALQSDAITYTRQPEFLTTHLWDQAAQCQVSASAATGGGGTGKSQAKKPGAGAGTTVQLMHLIGASVMSTKSVTIANSGQWSPVRANARAQAWPVEVDPMFDYSTGTPIQRFRFLPAGGSPAVPPPTSLKFDAPLTADYGTKVVYRQQAVVMRGNQLPFVATALVNSSVPLQFNVRTLGAAAGFYFSADEQRVMQLNNLPAAGAAQPGQDARLGSRVLQSPGGGYLLGREQGTPTAGAFSVVDALRSHHPATGASTLQRVWTSRAKGACADSDLVLNTAGDLVFVCNGTANWIYKNTDGGRPCRHLILSDAGELICYSGRTAAGDTVTDAQEVFRTPSAPANPAASAPAVTQHPYQMTWQQLTGNATQAFSFNGLYTGDRVVTQIVSCKDAAVTLPALPADCNREMAATRPNVTCDATRTALNRLRGRTQDTAGTQP